MEGLAFMAEKVVLMLDGAFVKKKLEQRLKHFPTVDDVVAFCASVMAKPEFKNSVLFRIYYYDAPPFEGSVTNPIDGTVSDFSTLPGTAKNKALTDALELKPNFAVRRGIVNDAGWKLGQGALKNLATAGPRAIAAGDLIPDLRQKGVDMRIGLDIAFISLRKVADVLVLITGDSDFVPAMKFARREGMRVYLVHMGHGVLRSLKAHADVVLSN
jgi:uncharacterized LabA/DUF88 family protein